MSTINDTDLILVTNGLTDGDPHKVEAGQLSTAADHNNHLLMERDGTLYKWVYGHSAMLEDDDLLMIARGGINYKVTGAVFKSIVDGVPWSMDIDPSARTSYSNSSLTAIHYQTVQAVDDGSVYLIAHAKKADFDTSGDTEIIVTKVGPGGDIKWHRNIDGDGWDQPIATSYIPSTGALVLAARTGSDRSSGKHDILLARFDADTGFFHNNIARYYYYGDSTDPSSTPDRWEYPRGIVRLSDGDFLVATSFQALSSHLVVFRVTPSMERYNTNTAWALRSYVAPFLSLYQCMAIDPYDDRVLLAATNSNYNYGNYPNSGPDFFHYERRSCTFAAVSPNGDTLHWYKHYTNNRHEGTIQPLGVCEVDGYVIHAIYENNKGRARDQSSEEVFQGITLIRFDVHGNFENAYRIGGGGEYYKGIPESRQALVTDGNMIYLAFADWFGNSYISRHQASSLTMSACRKFTPDSSVSQDLHLSGLSIDMAQDRGHAHNYICGAYGHSAFKVTTSLDIINKSNSSLIYGTDHPYTVDSFTPNRIEGLLDGAYFFFNEGSGSLAVQVRDVKQYVKRDPGFTDNFPAGDFTDEMGLNISYFKMEDIEAPVSKGSRR